MSPRDITAATGIHPATLTGLLDRLEKGGWLARSADPADRRRVIVEAGTHRAGELARLYGPMSKSLTEICADYTDDELKTIVTFLAKAADAGTTAAARSRDSAAQG